MVAMGFLRTGTKQSLLFVALEGKKKNLENHRLSNLPLIPGNVLKQRFQETLSRYRKDGKVTGSSQHGFMKGKSCLTNTVASCDGMDWLGGQGVSSGYHLHPYRQTDKVPVG